MMAAPSGKVGSLCLPVVGARVLITAGMVAPLRCRISNWRRLRRSCLQYL